MPALPTQAFDQPRPRVVIWFKIYSGVLCVLYFLTAAASLIFFLADPADLEMSAGEARAIAAVLLVMGVVLLAVCLVPLVTQPRPWLWTYDLVIICMGMTSACFVPAGIPLLIFWFKPETRRYFGKN